jgi:hypothetical protein
MECFLTFASSCCIIGVKFLIEESGIILREAGVRGEPILSMLPVLLSLVTQGLMRRNLERR